MPKILLINGPNLNLLGSRETSMYGEATLAEIESDMTRRAGEMGITLDTLQSNAEHELIDAVHAAGTNGIDAIIINPGAFTHTSIALRDAFTGVDIPFFEVHLSNIHAREPFRRVSYLSDIASGVIVGCGPIGYGLALAAAGQLIGS